MVALARKGDRLKALQEQHKETVDRMEALLEEDGDVQADFDALQKEADDLQAKIDREKKFLEEYNKLPTRESANRDSVEEEGSRIGKVEEQWIKDPKLGYHSHREFLLDVMSASKPGATPSKQLKYLASISAAAGTDEQNTLSDPYGGFLIPEAFMPGLKTLPVESDPTLGRVTSVPMTTPKININARVDKNHSSSVSGGFTVGRTSETQAIDSSRQAYEQVKLDTEAMTGLAYASEQLLEASPMSYAALIDASFRDEFASKMLDEKINGNGSTQAEGVINAACTVSIAKEGSQAADTINGTNIVKMRARCWRYGQSIWMANHDCYNQLCQAHLTMTNDDVPLFIPGNGIDVPDTLLGRPIYFTEYCPTVGDVGDIILGVWSEYLWGTFGGTQPRRYESMHVRFVNHERAFKFVMYNDGKCWWRSALTPKKGANTLSPFVTLAARA